MKQSTDLVAIVCTEPGCNATTLVDPAHALNVSLVWKCSRHYRRPTIRIEASR